MKIVKIVLYIGILIAFSSFKNSVIVLENKDIIMEVNDQMYLKISNKRTLTPLMKDFTASEYLVTKTFEAKQFIYRSHTSTSIIDSHGSATATAISGIYNKDGYQIEKLLNVLIYDSFPNMAFIKVQYVNRGDKNIDVLKWVNLHLKIQGNSDKPAFWSFQGESSNKRADWLLPIDSTFSQINYMGMTNTDYGGGIPITDIWRKDGGVGIGLVESTPKLVSLPVTKNEYSDIADISVEYDYPGMRTFKKGDTLHTFQSFIIVHNKDHFLTLSNYSRFMQQGGLKFIPDEPEAFEPVWCAWGYMQKFTMEEIEGTLQKVKDIGFKWVDIDDGYQMAEGDWNIADNRFPDGERAMINLVNKVHVMGLKAKIWWAPLAVDPQSKLFADNPDIVARNKDNAPQYITGWESYYMSPVYYKTIDHTKEVIKMFLKDWGFDGLKMDGMHLNCIGPDYNNDHHFERPELAFENLPEFFKTVYETAIQYKPHAVIQNCPCGCVLSFFNLPYMNQAVASDPVTSWQTRLKAKTIKALRPGIAYYGDHVELSDGGDDFASQFGVGAVLGSKFTWPKDNPYNTNSGMLLTPQKERVWKHWVKLYYQNMLSTGRYLGGLYDIAYDKPETHVIQKNDTLYYALYAKEWNGDVALRGLSKAKYNITAYENEKYLGVIDANKPHFKISFKDHLLLKLVPKK